MSKSLLGSIKSKLARRSSDKSQPSPAQARGSNNPFANSMAVAPGSECDAAPPAYTPTAAGGPSAPSSQLYSNNSSITNDDDKYAFLASFDTVFLVDDSGSMQGFSWREVAAVLRSITPICTAHDSDGIDLYFLNHRSGASAPAGKAKDGFYNINSPETVENIFRDARPYGITPTGARLQTIFKPYLASLAAAKDIDEVKPVNIIVITDGRPTDDPESILVQSARKLDQMDAPPHQVGVQFFQIGNDAGAREALRELDDDLAEQGIRDMVDTATWDSTTLASDRVLSADGILKVVLGAVVRRLDRKSTAGSPGRRG